MSDDAARDAFLGELKRCAKAGTPVALEYAAGTAPGQPRNVVITAANQQKVVAYTTATNERRTFFTRQIIAFALPGAPRVVNPREPEIDVTDIRLLPELASLAEYTPLLVDAFQAAGWHIESSTTTFALFAWFKNGKPRRTPAAAISFQPTLVDTIFDDETGDMIEVPHVPTAHDRPWHASWPGGGTSRSHVADVAQRFYAEMIGRVPDNRPRHT